MGDRRGAVRGVDDVRDHDGDVVRSAGPQGEVDQALRAAGRVGVAEQRLGEAVRAHHVGEPVAAEQPPVAGLRHHGGVGGGDGLALEGPGDHGPAGVAVRLLRADHPLVDQHLHERVVPGELGHRAAAQQVRPGVADVGQGEAGTGAGEQQRGQGGAHALPFRILGDGRPDARARRVHGALEGGDQPLLRRRHVQWPDRVDGDGAGQVTGRHSAHAVGHGEQPGSGVHGILVGAPDQATVADRHGSQLQAHGRQPAKKTARMLAVDHQRAGVAIEIYRTWLR
ncbi:hypothetical protein GCM10027615_68400 [Plantactinospora veratri]